MQNIFPIDISKCIFPKLDTFRPTIADRAGQDMKIQIVHPEFSSVCPVTGYPDFGRVVLRYVPDKLCVELKSWKIYLSSFYGVGCFHEQITEKVFSYFIEMLKPKWAFLLIDWGARGGLKTITQVDYWKKGSDGEPIEINVVDLYDWSEFERSVDNWTNS